jgi:hypothetical protein
LGLSLEEREGWLRELLTGTHTAVTAAIQDSDLFSGLSVDSNLDQIGTQAEAVDIAVSIVSGIAANIATDLMRSYGKKGSIALAGQLERLMRKREKFVSGRTYNLVPTLPPEFLVLMALEELGPRFYEDGKPDIAYSRVDPDQLPPFMAHRQLYKIELRTGNNRATCWITDRGEFHRIEFNGFPQQEYRSREFSSDDGSYPSQDGIDRSDHVAVIARLSLAYERRDPARDMDINELSGELHSILDDEVRDALRDMRIRGSESVLSSAPYQVGPAAGGLVDLGHQVLTLLKHSDQLTSYLDDVPTYYFFYRMFVELPRRVREKIEARKIPGVSVVFVNTEAELKALCALYVRVVLDQEPTGETSLQCLTKEFYAGYRSPAHPTEDLEYLAIVPVGSGAFQFRLFGDGHIRSLTFSDGEYTQVLQKLDRLDEIEWKYDPNDS